MLLKLSEPSLHLSKGTNNTPLEGVGGLDVAQSLAERGSRREGSVRGLNRERPLTHLPTSTHSSSLA